MKANIGFLMPTNGEAGVKVKDMGADFPHMDLADLVNTWQNRFKSQTVYVYGRVSIAHGSGVNLRISGIKPTLTEALLSLASGFGNMHLREDENGDLICRRFGYKNATVKIRPLMPGAYTRYHQMKKEGLSQEKIHRSMMSRKNTFPAEVTYEVSKKAAEIFNQAITSMVEAVDAHLAENRAAQLAQNA